MARGGESVSLLRHRASPLIFMVQGKASPIITSRQTIAVSMLGYWVGQLARAAYKKPFIPARPEKEKKEKRAYGYNSKTRTKVDSKIL